jgi:small-conductance mechanosensitive channel
MKDVYHAPSGTLATLRETVKILMENVSLFIERYSGIGPDLQIRLLLSIVTLAGLWVARRVAGRILRRKVSDPRGLFLWQRTASYIAVIVGLIILARIWFQSFAGLATFLGLASAGIAIALRELIANIAGWFYIILRRPFVLGDRIEVAGVRGDVVDIRVLGFSLMEVGKWVAADQSTGRIVHVPNGKVFSEHIANYTSGTNHIWEEVPVLITFESDWRKAKSILEDIMSEVVQDATELTSVRSDEAGRYLIYQGVSTPIVYTSVQSSGVLLTTRFPVQPRQRRASVQKVWETILGAFAEHGDIDFAYPTTRFYRGGDTVFQDPQDQQN